MKMRAGGKRLRSKASASWWGSVAFQMETWPNGWVFSLQKMSDWIGCDILGIRQGTREVMAMVFVVGQLRRVSLQMEIRQIDQILWLAPSPPPPRAATSELHTKPAAPSILI